MAIELRRIYLILKSQKTGSFVPLNPKILFLFSEITLPLFLNPQVGIFVSHQNDLIQI